jgi:hypothetical protein
MSSNSLRLIAVAVALIIAVLTGAATGLLAGAPDCPAAPAAGPVTTAPTTPATKEGGTTPNQPDGVVAAGVQAQAGGAAACTKQEAFGFKAALTSFVGALFVGAALLLLLLLASRRPAPAPGAPARGGSGQADADRRALVQASIYVRDRVTSKALGDRLGAALREAGVTTLEPAGVRFDPAHHEAGGTTPTPDPGLSGHISGVEVPGYVDRDGRVLRAPIVTVYQAARNAGGPTGTQQVVPPAGRHTSTQATQPVHPGRAGQTGQSGQTGQTGQHTTQQPRREQPR